VNREGNLLKNSFSQLNPFQTVAIHVNNILDSLVAVMAPSNYSYYSHVVFRVRAANLGRFCVKSKLKAGYLNLPGTPQPQD
jgi:hypothetical protein